jgi:hypothetical protein
MNVEHGATSPRSNEVFNIQSKRFNKNMREQHEAGLNISVEEVNSAISNKNQRINFRELLKYE